MYSAVHVVSKGDTPTASRDDAFGISGS
jgi:hypothetical protein